MASYLPPTLHNGVVNTTFNPDDFSASSSLYVNFPQAQGTVTFPNAIVNGLLTTNTLSASGSTTLPANTKIDESYVNSTDNYTTFNRNTSVGGTNNCFFGKICGQALVLGQSGAQNTAVGQSNVLKLCTSGSNNSAFGTGSLENVVSTSNNTAYGYASGSTTTGSNNTFIGSGADATTAASSNSTAIGYNAKTTASNQVVLGTSTETVVIPNTITYSYSSVPTFTSNQIGYSVTTTSTNSINFTIAGLMFCATSGLPIGVYIIGYQFSQNSGSQNQIVLVNNASGTPAARTDITPLMFGAAGTSTTAGAITYKSTSASNVFGICGFAFSGTNNAYVCQIQLTRIA
jgi:hypothetical protein